MRPRVPGSQRGAQNNEPRRAHTLAELFLEHGILAGQSETGCPIWVSRPLVEPGSPWENGYIGPFNGKLLNRELFHTLKEGQILVEHWQ